MEFLSKLSIPARVGLIVGVALIALCVGLFGYWALRSQYVMVASQLSAEKTAAAAKALEAAKIPYRVSEDGSTIEVVQDQAGKARMELAGTSVGLGSNQGFELFNNTDFSATDFSQRVNYQRALQGELTRTIQSIEGVTTARVHLVLPEGNGLRRRGAKATAAVAVALTPGKILSPAQIRGVQRLVAAAIPEIKVDDVTVIDFSGAALSRAAYEESGMSSSQLELKREADAYLESKLTRLLRQALPAGNATVSVDVALNFDQIKVTTERPLSAKTSAEGEREVGVVIKERQTQRSEPRNAKEGSDASINEVVNFEYDYKVGHQVEQSLQTPGGIKRISIAVVTHGVPSAMTTTELSELVGNAAGIVRTRGDAVSVIMLPTAGAALPGLTPEGATSSERTDALPAMTGQSRIADEIGWLPILTLLGAVLALSALAFLCAWLLWRRHRKGGRTYTDEELSRLADQVRVWLRDGSTHAA